jgi:L-ribulose-5-phosphate 3-epimerase
MQLFTRRAFIGAGASTALATLSLPALASGAKVRFKVGVTDWNLKLEGKIESISLAKQLGFDGVQISIGKGKTNCLFPIPRCRKHF